MKISRFKLALFSLFLSLVILPQKIFCSDTKTVVDSINSMPYEFIVSNLVKSISIFTENVERARSIDYEYGEGKAYYNLGLATYLNGKYDKSSEYNLRAISLFERLNAIPELITTYGKYGYQLRRIDSTKALYYLSLAIHLAEQNKVDTVLSTLYDNFGVLHESNIDSSLYYYKKSLNIKYQMSDSVGIPYSLNNIAIIYAMKGKHKKAFEILDESDKYRNKETGDYGRTENLVLRADIFADESKIDSAIFYYHKSLELSQKINYTKLVQYCYEQLAVQYEIAAEYKNALLYQKKFAALKDSIDSFKTNSRIAELEIAYESEKKDRLISENELQIRQKEQQLYLFGLIILFLILAAAWIYLYQKQKRKRLADEMKLKNLLRQAELEKKLSDEKLRISRELHDNIGSQLTFLISSIDNLSYSKEKTNLAERLDGLSSYGRNTIKELRNTIWAMKHEDSNLDQLILKLNELKQEINSNIRELNVEIKNDTNAMYVLSSSQILNLYRIVQEALQNVIKHSGATEVKIYFSGDSSTLRLKITDNGKGFDIKNLSSGNGLQNMKQRCENSDGEFKINTSDIGTEIICSLTIKYDE